jgi:hypothetical protein
MSSRQPPAGNVYADEHHSIAVSGNVILSYSKQPPNPRYLAAWDRTASRLATQGTIFAFTIIDGNSPTPDEPARQAIRQAIGRHEKQLSALAYVVEGRGFGAAAVRSALSLISLAARYPFPQRVFATAPEAAAWLAAARGTTSNVPNLLSTVELMRSSSGALAVAG